MNSAALVFNSGSSSIKFALYAKTGTDFERLLAGQIDNVEETPHFTAIEASGEHHERDLPSLAGPAKTRAGAFEHLLVWLEQRTAGLPLVAAGHRVVHGGAHYREPVPVDRKVLKDLLELVPLAPLHQPHNLAAIRTLLDVAPKLLQVACFDTAFHATQLHAATLFAIPRELIESGILRYGFHGLSYEYIADALPAHLGERADGRIVVAHLGNGASLCALKGRRSVATSMGFTALDGLMMGTRPGTVDPGVLLYLMEERGMDAKALADLLYHRCGLLGVSGISHDMRTLLASSEPNAKEAVDLFVYRAATQIGALAVALGGLDALVFTAGIGEHAAPIRARICAQLQWLGLRLDEGANEKHGPKISTGDSRCTAWVIATNEELMIARHAFRFVLKA